MKRNLKLLKEILVEIEAAPTFDRPLNIRIPEFTNDEIEYHINLLEEAQLIKVLDGAKGMMPSPTCLTGPGHDFLSTIRNKTVWEQTTKFLKEKGGDFTLSIVKAISTKYLESHLGL